MSKPIKSEKLSDSLTLGEFRDGFWLYDKTRGMNLSMRARTERAAFLEALDYYQRRAQQVESELAETTARLQSVIDIVAPDLPDLG